METNRVLYKNTVDRHECTIRKITCLQSYYYVIYFGLLFVIVPIVGIFRSTKRFLNVVDHDLLMQKFSAYKFSDNSLC